MDKSEYDHLRIDLPRDARKLPSHNGILYTLQTILVSNPPIYRVIKRSLRTLRHMDDLKTKHLKSLELLKQDSVDANLYGSQYGYEDDLHELSTAIKYKEQLDNGVNSSANESGVLYRHAEDVLTNLLTADPNLKHFINFGVSYAHIDSVLAVKFPAVTFIGIDRSTFTKHLNEEWFSHLKNMQFVAGDIFDFLAETDLTGGVFYHTRTLALLPRSFIERLYSAVKRAKFMYIVGMEMIGISRQTLRPYDFTNQAQASVVFRDGMYIHNYPGILNNAGFDMTRAELVRTNHPHADYRILSYTGHRGAHHVEPSEGD